jgi:hypothetical protein
MKFSDFENNDSSIYSEEDYQQITGGKYGKEIFVPHNDISKHSNGKANKKRQQQKLQVKRNTTIITSEKEQERKRILDEIQKLRQENSDLTFKHWSNTLNEKRQKLIEKINEYFPKISFKILLELDFVLAIKSILNIEDITLPFMGIVFAAPSSMKTKVIEILRKWYYSYFIDKFTAKSFVSHSATVTKEKLNNVDLLPRIKDKIVLTPELSPLFTGKEEDTKEQFGIITRLLDGNGLETESGVHGKRGYYGDYMFTWIGAAVDIPHSVYKFLSTIGFKIYFLRLPRSDVTTDDLVDQILSEKSFNEKMRDIEKILLDYLNWFEIYPLSIGFHNVAKVEWDKTKDDRKAIKIIAQLAILLAHLRGNVVVYKSSDREDFIHLITVPSVASVIGGERVGVNNNYNSTATTHSEGFIHSLPTIEDPSRANQQLYNLARGHALSYGRNYITEDDIPLIIKVVLSTASIERVLILDLLIAYKGTLTTSQITTAMRMSNNTAKRTMTEFKGLELVTMERINNDYSNSEYKIIFNKKFEWFLSEEFSKLRNEFKPSNNNNDDDQSKSETNNKNTSACCDENTLCVANEESEKVNNSIGKKMMIVDASNYNNNDDIYSHKGENCHSKNNTAEVANNTQSNSASTLSSSSTFTTLMPLQQQSMESKIQAGLFTNPLISESDLLTGNYDPEIINNIDRVHLNSDRWFCYNCNLRDDKWGMMKHFCKHNKKRKTKEEKEN